MSRPQPHVDGVSHRFVDAGGLRLHVAEAGAPDAPGGTVVLVHGWPQHWYEWRHLIPRLAEHHHVVCPDLRGLGWSDAPDARYDLETFRRDVVGALDALGVERFHLAGHDWGGWVSFLICLHHPERVRRFLALNIAHPWQRVDLPRLASYWRFGYQIAIAGPLGPRLVRRLPELTARDPARYGVQSWTPEERESFLGQFREPARARASQRLYRSFQLLDLPRSLAGGYNRLRLHTPTLMLYGTEDKVVRPEHLEGFERHADDMRLEMVPGIGHFIVDEAPELVERRALAHFGAVGARAPAAASR